MARPGTQAHSQPGDTPPLKGAAASALQLTQLRPASSSSPEEPCSGVLSTQCAPTTCSSPRAPPPAPVTARCANTTDRLFQGPQTLSIKHLRREAALTASPRKSRRRGHACSSTRQDDTALGAGGQWALPPVCQNRSWDQGGSGSHGLCFTTQGEMAAELSIRFHVCSRTRARQNPPKLDPRLLESRAASPLAHLRALKCWVFQKQQQEHPCCCKGVIRRRLSPRTLFRPARRLPHPPMHRLPCSMGVTNSHCTSDSRPPPNPGQHQQREMPCAGHEDTLEV